MKLIADSGSTKTDWCVVEGGNVLLRMAGRGINPFQQDAGVIERVVSEDLVGHLDSPGRITEIEFYGAGCRDNMIYAVEQILVRLFVNADRIEVCSDMLGAARALFGSSEGIACILGTGSNSCLYDGNAITANVPPLGYILGDEGSGAVLGRLFVNALFKGGLPGNLRKAFVAETGYDVPYIINRVYREPQANRFLASLSVFIHKHLDNSRLRTLVIENFKAFFRHNVSLYGRRDTAVGAVGSIAYYYKAELEEAALAEGYTLAKVIRDPMEGLIDNERQLTV